MTRASWAILAAVLLAGCATPVTVAGGKVGVSSQGFEVDLPQGWTSGYWSPPGDPGLLILTRDGFELQCVSVSRSAIKRELDPARETFGVGMSPEEAAAIEADNLRAGRRSWVVPQAAAVEFDLLESASATVAGKAGFRLVYTWKTSSGLRMKGVEYGIIHGQWIYRLSYQGIARHYFDRDLPTFETVVGSFRLLGAPQASVRSR